MNHILSWNYRGIGVAMTVQALRDLVSHFRPSILFLCETKAKKRKVDHHRHILAFDYGFIVDAVSRSGGLALFWKNDVSVSVLSSCKNFIHTKVEMNAINFSGYLTGVYGDPVASLRKNVWSSISNLRVSNNKAWLCCGDFNEVLNQNEKQGLRPSDDRAIQCFREFLDYNSLQDMNLKGCQYTWSNNREFGLVRERIDRILCNGPWLFKFPDSTLIALPALGSDHSPLVLQLPKNKIRKSKAFCYEEFWEDHEELPSIIDCAWSMLNAVSIVDNIKNVQAGLKDWSTQKFKHAPNEIARLKKQIVKLENSSDRGTRHAEINKCKELISKLWDQEELYWRARSRLQWLKGGNKNSKYFHATTLQRRSRNKVARLKDSSGVWVDEENGLKELIRSYFSSLFETTNPTMTSNVTNLIQPRVTHAMNQGLLKPVEEWEVKHAVFSLGTHKSPGPDGLNGLFFQKHWDSVKGDVINLVQNFFTLGVLPKELNETHIALIPKSAMSEEVSQFRLISCCNFSYKIISKVMAERMKGIMQCLVSDSQSAFVKGRQIQDNVLIAHET